MGLKGHTGIDMPAIHGETVYHAATYDGWMKIEKDQQGGIGVDVVSNEPVKLKDGTESYVKLRYWHLKSAIGWDKKPVVYGQPIALADNTGASSGDHLHWAPKRCTKEGITLNNGNGYGGAFDPMPYYTNEIFAGDAPLYIEGLQKPQLTAQERKEITSQLSATRRFFLDLRERLYKI
jgi:murein DD-endopeptidase MepM/ murein hydrolase activator NlpD